MSEQLPTTPQEAQDPAALEARTADQIALIHDKIGETAMKMGLEGNTNFGTELERDMAQNGGDQGRRFTVRTQSEGSESPSSVSKSEFITDGDYGDFEVTGMGWDDAYSRQHDKSDGSSRIKLGKSKQDYGGYGASSRKGVELDVGDGKVSGKFFKKTEINPWFTETEDGRRLEPVDTEVPLTLQESRDAAAKIFKAQRRAMQKAKAERVRQANEEKDNFLSKV